MPPPVLPCPPPVVAWFDLILRSSIASGAGALEELTPPIPRLFLVVLICGVGASIPGAAVQRARSAPGAGQGRRQRRTSARGIGRALHVGQALPPGIFGQSILGHGREQRPIRHQERKFDGLPVSRHGSTRTPPVAAENWQDGVRKFKRTFAGAAELPYVFLKNNRPLSCTGCSDIFPPPFGVAQFSKRKHKNHLCHCISP